MPRTLKARFQNIVTANLAALARDDLRYIIYLCLLKILPFNERITEDSKVSVNVGQVLGFLIEMWPLIFQLSPGTAYVGFKLCELKKSRQ